MMSCDAMKLASALSSSCAVYYQYFLRVRIACSGPVLLLLVPLAAVDAGGGLRPGTVEIRVPLIVKMILQALAEVCLST